VIGGPHGQPGVGEGVHLLHLGPQKGGDDLAGQVGRSHIEPTGVLVHLAAHEQAAVGALLADNFRTLGKARVVDQRVAFPRDDVPHAGSRCIGTACDRSG
jgi:hypothetical protein